MKLLSLTYVNLRYRLFVLLTFFEVGQLQAFWSYELGNQMLHRKIYQLCCDEREVWVFLRDQQRWIERAKVLDIEGDLVTLRYEVDEDDEVCAWEELIRLDSIGSISQKLSTVSRLGGEPLVSDECPEAERLVELPSAVQEPPANEVPNPEESAQEVEPISERRPEGNAEA